MIIVTSLNPHNASIERQLAALQSWENAGFKAVSLNFNNEYEKISQKYGKLIQIMQIRRACSGSPRKKLVALADLIETSYEMNESKIALVLNADIVLRSPALIKTKTGPDDLIMIPRWDISCFPPTETPRQDPWGFDGVLLGSNLRNKFVNRSFGLGLPWWDYWIPFRGIYLGYRPKIIRSCLALHVSHQEKWDERDRARLAKEIWREIGVSIWKRFWRRHFGEKHERKYYGYHNHLAGYIREIIEKNSDKIAC